MATNIITVHPVTPEIRKIENIVEEIVNGAVILYPTDTGLALGCALSNKNGIAKIRSLRKLSEHKSMTFLCDSLSNIAEFAKVGNTAYRTIKHLIPGPYTFILPATKAVPRFAQDPKRQTTGIRVPDANIAQAILKTLGTPLISISAKLEEDIYRFDYEEIFDRFASQVDIAVTDDDYTFVGESTIIDMTTDNFAILREGAGLDEALAAL